MKHFADLSPAAERVLDAAEALVQQQGYNGISYDDVARVVGIKKPSIHHHFATKADLVATVAQRYTHRFREQLLHIESRHADARRQLLEYAQLFERTFERDRRLCVCGMLGAESAGLPESVRVEVVRFFDANLRWLHDTFERARVQGLEVAPAASADLARSLLSALEGAMVLGRGLGDPHGPAQVGQALLGVLIR